jgi:hypothetical protein
VAARANDASGAGGLLVAVPGLVRIAAGAWWRSTGWTFAVTMRAGDRLVRAAVSGEPVTDLFADAGASMRAYAREVLGLLEEDGENGDGDQPRTEADVAQAEVTSLRDRGAELLRRSADVREREYAHPAYERILGELAPDEGRILRLLAIEGPQASVDVRTGRKLAPGTQLTAPGLSMIDAESGARYRDRVPAYLNNLYRLGLIWFSREPLPNPLQYQVLEAQPEVVEAMREGGRSRTVRRSIHLTPFGSDFCETCLPLHTGELDALPGSAAPDEMPGLDGAVDEDRASGDDDALS